MSGKEAQIILLQFISITPTNKVVFDKDGADAGCPGLAAWFLLTWTSLQSQRHRGTAYVVILLGVSAQACSGPKREVWLSCCDL